MNKLLCLAFFVLVSVCNSVDGYICNNDSPVSKNPVIGIISMERYIQRHSTGKSYIAASYVKYLESAGAQVVPIAIGKSDEYYSKLAPKLNGVMFPGGGVKFEASDYTRVAEIFLNVTLSRTQTLPIWGTCLGYEMILYLLNQKKNPFFDCDCIDRQSDINFVHNNTFLKKRSRMFYNATLRTLSKFRSKNVTINYHKRCVPSKLFKKGSEIGKMFRVLADQKDAHDVSHVAIIEGKKLPIFGVQFHPEKPMFEFFPSSIQKQTMHTPESIEVGQYLANFFVSQTRKNQNCFSSLAELQKYLIYNYNPKFVALDGGTRFEQIYLFPY